MKKIIFGFLFIVIPTLFASFIANDRPLFLLHNNTPYFPVFKTYSQADFGTSVDKPLFFYDSSFGENIINSSSFVIHPPVRYAPQTIDLTQSAPFPPTAQHWLGTDDHGRDIFTRLLYGLRLSVIFGLVLSTLGLAIGTSIGSIQGFMGGNFDIAIGRLVDLWTSIPFMFVLLIIASFTQPGFFMLVGLCLMFNWIQVAAVTRAEFYRARKLDYVMAAEVLGVSRSRIAIKHIFPNIIFSVIVYYPYLFNNAIVQLTALTFLGFGLPSETASLGDLLNQAKENLNAPWIGLSVIVTLVTLLTLLMSFGEQLRSTYKGVGK